MSGGTDHVARLWAETEPLGRRRDQVARWMCEDASGFDGDEFVDVLDQPATERPVHHLDSMVARCAPANRCSTCSAAGPSATST